MSVFETSPTKEELGLAFVENILNKRDATADPTVNADASLGYSVGSYWVNVSTGESFVCVDSSVAAAKWALTTSPFGLDYQRVESLGISTSTDLINWTDKVVLTTPVLTGRYLLRTDFVSSNLDKTGEHQLWDDTNSLELWRKDSRIKINEASTSSSVSLLFTAQARVLKLRFRGIVVGTQVIRLASLTFNKVGI
ncbi:MAG TPA: hypothetical protein VM537_03480 [Anaerolineae bacterium]|nr:hypothetical protein [Anaerolineae bacterium]